MVVRIKKLKGTTLVEAIVSMTLVLFFAALIFGFLTKFSSSNSTALSLKLCLVSEIISKTIKTTKVNDNTSNDVQYKKKLTPLNDEKGIYLLEIDFLKENKIVFSKKEIIINPTISN